MFTGILGPIVFLGPLLHTYAVDYVRFTMDRIPKASNFTLHKLIFPSVFSIY
jgi:hypothetical protein